MQLKARALAMQDDACQWALRLVIAAAVLAVVLPAQAQFGGARRGGGAGGGTANRPARDGDETAAPARGQQLANQLYEVRVRLMLTAVQTPAWERLYAALLAQQAQTGAFGAPGEEQGAQQAAQLLLAAARERYTRAQALAEAMQALYTELDESQQHTADQLLPPLLQQQAGGRGATPIQR